jgi:polysaccharide export outer membrane protein
MKNFKSTPLVALAAIAIFCSCGSVKYPELVMMQNVQNHLAAIDTMPALKIQADDLLSIQVTSAGSAELIAAFSSQTTVTGGSGENALGIQEGYRVDDAGNIHLPYLGKVRAAEKTVFQLRQDIETKLLAYIPDVTVQVRFLNFRVTMMGEVTRPNAYIIPNERLNILQAVGMAGDFTPYAKRNTVLVMRERNQIREFARVNTQDTSLFSSPYFYLQPNDVVYVEPLEAKKYATQGDFLNRYSGVLFPAVTLITFFLGVAIAQ